MKPKILHREEAEEETPPPAKKPVLKKVEVRENLYFSTPKEHLETISSGCEILNCVLGGGWPLGRIANLVGDKSTGKCARDFYFITEDGLFYSDTLGEDFHLGQTLWKKRLALDSMRSSQATHFHKEVVQQTYRLVTEHGFELTATPDHKVMVLTPDLNLEMQRVEDVQEGQHIVIAPKTKLFPKQLQTFYVELITKPRFYPCITVPQHVTPALAGLCGFFIADGTLSSGPLVISNTKKWAVNAITALSEEAFGTRPKKLNGGWGFVEQVREVLEALLEKKTEGMTARYKFVPPAILQSPEEVQRAFLKALISCDSEVTDNGIGYVTASKRLAREVQMMLLNFGVVATLQEKWVRLKGWDEARPYWSLSIFGRRFDELLKEIGLYRKVNKKPTTKDTSTYLTVPYAGDFLRFHTDEARREKGWARNGRGKPCPQTGLYTRRAWPALSRSQLEKARDSLTGYITPDAIQQCTSILETNYVFEQVLTKEKICGPQTVYDVHVPEGHLFWSSGFISHNTLLAIEAMANFLLQYPDGNVVYCETEAAFDDDYASALGLNLKRVVREECATVEELFDNMVAFIETVGKDGQGLYIVDSLDALSDKAEQSRGIADSTYGASKPKQLGQLFRRLVKPLEKSNVCVIIVSQVRDAIGVTFGDKHTRSGGRALDFYASQILWLANLGQIKKTVNKTQRTVGVTIRAKTKKNKIGLPFRECTFDILFGYGIDDITSNLEFLKAAGELHRWKIGSTDTAITNYKKEFMNSTVKEQTEKRRQLAELVRTVWYQIERAFLPKAGKYQV